MHELKVFNVPVAIFCHENRYMCSDTVTGSSFSSASSSSSSRDGIGKNRNVKYDDIFDAEFF